MCEKFRKGDLIIATSSIKSDKSFMHTPIKFISYCGCGHSVRYEWTDTGISGKQGNISMEKFEAREFRLYKPCSWIKRACCCCCDRR